MQRELFISTQQGIESLSSIVPNIENFITHSNLVKESNGLYRNVVISNISEASQCFIPFSIFLGKVLSIAFLCDSAIKMKLYAFVSISFQVLFQNYAPLASLNTSHILNSQNSIRNNNSQKNSNSRFAELGLSNEEFEQLHQEKCLDAYRSIIIISLCLYSNMV